MSAPDDLNTATAAKFGRIFGWGCTGVLALILTALVVLIHFAWKYW